MKQRHIALLTALVLILALAVGVFLWLRANPPRRYPMEYVELVRTNALSREIPPAWVAAVILAESSYDPQAISSVGARGLMQIMPETAEWISKKFDEPCDLERLFDPETNIRYGCWYLGYLFGRFGDMRAATAAYHAGQGSVDKWLQNPEYSSDGKTLKVIPFESTATYVERVMKYYEKYQKLYVTTQSYKILRYAQDDKRQSS